MKRNIRLTIEYDGSRYQGWQRLGGDSNANTIQGKLESVLSKMTGQEKMSISMGLDVLMPEFMLMVRLPISIQTV